MLEAGPSMPCAITTPLRAPRPTAQTPSPVPCPVALKRTLHEGDAQAGKPAAKTAQLVVACNKAGASSQPARPAARPALSLFRPPQFTHRTPCSSPDCAECHFRAHYRAWWARLTTGKWLTAKVVNGIWSPGCVVCQHLLELPKAKRPLISAPPSGCSRGALATFQQKTIPKFQCLQRHEQNQMHQAATALLKGKEALRILKRRLAPQEDAFETVWELARGGGNRTGFFRNLGRQKRRRMEYTLAEAIRERQRAFLRRAETIGVQLDKRGASLLVRFAGADAAMTLQTGVLGLGRCVGDHVEQLKAFDQVLTRFCTRRAHYPQSGRKRSLLSLGQSLVSIDADFANSHVDTWTTKRLYLQVLVVLLTLTRSCCRRSGKKSTTSPLMLGQTFSAWARRAGNLCCQGSKQRCCQRCVWWDGTQRTLQGS